MQGRPCTAAAPSQPPTSGQATAAGSLWRLTLCSLGIVFGDIGTSPLYTLKECLIVANRDRPAEQADLFRVVALAGKTNHLANAIRPPVDAAFVQGIETKGERDR